jgi:hypothetical protein
MGVHICPQIPLYFNEGFWYKVCLPEIVDCDPNPYDGLIGDCENNWNNSLCQADLCFSMPVFQGDKLQFQTRWRNPGGEEFAEWISVKLYKASGELVSDVPGDFLSRYGTFTDAKGDYQLYEVDTSLEAFEEVDCFRLEIQTFIQGEEANTILNFGCTEDFCFITDCDAYPLFKPVIKGYDAFGYWYGEPLTYTDDNFKFEPAYRIHGEVLLKGTESQKVITGESVSLLNVREVYHVDVLDWVAPYFLKLLARTILAGKYVEVDGFRYETSDQTITRTNKGNRNLSIAFNLYKNVEAKQTIC